MNQQVQVPFSINQPPRLLPAPWPVTLRAASLFSDCPLLSPDLLSLPGQKIKDYLVSSTYHSTCAHPQSPAPTGETSVPSAFCLICMTRNFHDLGIESEALPRYCSGSLPGHWHLDYSRTGFDRTPFSGTVVSQRL